MEDRRVGSTGGMREAGASDLDAEAVALMKEVLREVREASEKLAAAAQSASELIASTGTIPAVSSGREDSVSTVSPLQESVIASVPQVDTIDGIPIVSRAVAFSEEESFLRVPSPGDEALSGASAEQIDRSPEQYQPVVRTPIVPDQGERSSGSDGWSVEPSPVVGVAAQAVPETVSAAMPASPVASPAPIMPSIPAEIVEAAYEAIPEALRIEPLDPIVQAASIPPQAPGQTVYFTTTISNIPPAAQYVAPSEPAPVEPPYVPEPSPQPLITEVPEAQPTPITLLDPDLESAGNLDDPGADIDYTEPLPIPVLSVTADVEAALESPRMAFSPDDVVDIDHAKDFDMVAAETGERIPWAPFMILMFAGAILTAFSSWTLLQTPKTLSVYEDSYFLGLMMTAIGLSALALFVVLPVWLIARTEKSMRRGLFTRCLFRGALTATLVTLLWAASVVVVDMIRSGAISL